MRRVAGLMVMALALAGCAGGTGDGAAESEVTSVPPLTLPTSADDAGSTTEPAPSTEPGPPPEQIDLGTHITDDKLLDQTTWVLDLLDPDARGPEVREVEKRFTTEFLDQVPAIQLSMIFSQLRAGGPYTVTEATQGSTPPSASLRLHAGEEPLVMSITLDDEGRVAGLIFQPDTSGDAPDLTSWSDLDNALAELGGTTQVVVGEVKDGACVPVHTTAGLEPGGEPAPTGSIFKLMVLAGVVEAVEADELAWDDELTITDEVKSLPSGTLQDRASGSKVTVQEAAELMISISDNTATDLLIDEVGRPRLRAAIKAAGVDAQRVVPLATTKELFILGWGVDQEIRDRWAGAQVAETRAAILADLPKDLSTVDVAKVTTPVWQDRVDWLLTGGEICSVHARLQELADTPAGEPVRDILSANPGGDVPDGVTYQGFKGGSVPGVLALSYYIETKAAEGGAGPDGLVLVVQTRSEEPVDQLRAMTIVGAGLRHLAGADG